MTLPAFPKPSRPARDPRQRGGFKRKPMRHKPPRRLDGPGSDPAFLAFVRIQACAGTVDFPGHVCRGPMEANHATQGRGIGQKAPDRRSFTMDHELHRLWHAHRGPFLGWSKGERRAFEERHIQRMLDEATPGDRESALRLQGLGLGTWDEASATWTPGPQQIATASGGGGSTGDAGERPAIPCEAKDTEGAEVDYAATASSVSISGAES